MASANLSIARRLWPNQAGSQMAGPVLILLILSMMVLPLPTIHAGFVVHLQYRDFGHRHAGRDECR